MWDSPSTEMKHKMVTLVTAWQSQRARRIEADMPDNLPEVFDDDDPKIDTGSDDTAPEPTSVHTDFTME